MNECRYFVMVNKHRGILSDEDAVEEEANKGYPRTRHVIFLTENYNADNYSFESLECCRRQVTPVVCVKIVPSS